ncbi:MAG: transcriptional activator domain [Ilumatobacteraceae bacterium]|nr:transcriptional activator domain [Ilumatobacteraceae bacterium]
MLSISVLGPVEVRRAGRPIPIPAGKTSEILVRLALAAGTPVRTDRLLEDLWGDNAIHTTRNTVQSKIAKLRRAMGEPSVIVGGAGGYTLVVDPVDIDALSAPTRAAEAAALLDNGDNRGAAQLCAVTLQMFRGDALAAAGEGDWVRPHRARLDAARMHLIETGCAARLCLGDTHDVIGDLELAVDSYPYQESLWLLLITALHQSGRSTDALAAYQRVRHRLAEDLGLDPGSRLQQLERQILRHDTAIPPLPPPTRLGGNLPPLVTDLVGRDDEITAVCELLASNRLVEIVGTGGIGKTALAIAAGRASTSPQDGERSGVWLARLEAATTADAVVDTLIAAVNVTGGEAALYERFRGGDALIILDNCEHVVGAAAELAVHLLETCPGVRILCTSQVSLDIDGAARFELAPLHLDDAAELFTRRCAAHRKHRRLGDDHDAIFELCRSLDGLPLAIELAAARTKTLSIDDIIRRLDDRFNVLNDPTSRRPERRRALKATIRWSYELLFPDDQRGLWALAAFAGGASLAGVEAVMESLDVPAAAAIDVVGRLASRSLVIVDDDESMQVRYRLLDSVRAFALEAMATTETTDIARAAHAAWFAQAARTSTAGVRGSRQAEHLAFARAERANIDAALAWSMVHDPLLAVGIATGLGWAWVVLGDSRASQRLLAALESAGSTAPADRRANALLLAGWAEASTGDLALARHHIAQATEIAVSLDDVDLLARGCYYLAYVESHDGDFRRALELTDRSRSLYTGLDRAWDQAANALFAARAAISAGDEDRSIEASNDVGRWLHTVDDPWLHVRYDAVLGELARLQHRFDDAVIHIGRAVATSNRLGFLQTEAYQTFSLGRARCQAGDYDNGAATLALAVDKAEATGDARMATLARVHLGRVLRALGSLRSARAALEAAAAWHRTAGGGEQAALGDCLLAAMDAADHLAGADARLQVILEDAQTDGAAHIEVLALDALARLAAEHGDGATARRLGQLADRRMESATAFITDRDRIDAHATQGENPP